MTEHIGVLEAYIEGKVLKQQNFKLYNINGDPSYIPSYPGLSGYIDASKSIIYRQKFNTDRYMNFQLLGDSSNRI